MKLSRDTSATATSVSVSTSFSTDTRPSASSVSSASASASSSRPSSSIAQLLRGVLQNVKKHRKRGEREKFLRSLEKSGVDFASALLFNFADDDTNAPPPSRLIESSRSSSRSNLSSSTSISNSRIPTRDCMRSLDRIEKLQVRATVESARDGGTLVTLQLLLLASPQRGGGTLALLQQPQLQSQTQLAHGASGIVVYQGISSLRQQRVHELTRPFDDFRKLRKMIAFCVHPRRENDEDHHHRNQNEEPASPQCSYCSEVRVFVAQCWERPPLLETSMLSSNCTIRKGVLASSMLHFVRLAKSEPLFPPRHFGDNQGGALGRGSAAGTTSGTDTNANPNEAAAPPVPKCQAHAEIATILHDFFRLQRDRRAVQ